MHIRVFSLPIIRHFNGKAIQENITMRFSDPNKFYEIFSMNALKGEQYYLKFRDDPTIYVGIPLLRSRFAHSNPETFTVQILLPGSRKGIYQKRFDTLEYIEKRS